MEGPIVSNPLDKYLFLSLFSDERLYVQFILNFITNSIKFTPAGGVVTVLLNMVSVTDADEPKDEGKDDNKTVPSSVNFDLEKNKIDEAIIAERI